MPGVVRLNQKELAALIRSTEAGGGDATELRNLLSEMTGNPAESELRGFEFSPSQYVEAKRDKAKVVKGENLICVICKKRVDILFADVCDACFQEWMLSTMPKKRTDFPPR